MTSTMKYLKPIAIDTGFPVLDFMRKTPCQAFIYKGFGFKGCVTLYRVIEYMGVNVK